MIGYFSRTEAAKKLGVSYGTMLKYEHAGIIKPHKDPLNGWALYNDEILKEFLDKVKGEKE